MIAARRLAALAFAGMTLVAPVGAQTGYPNRPVKLLVGAVPGGAPDIVARLLGERFAQLLGQQFVTENRPGAGGTVVPGQLAKMAPDGYSLLVADIGQLVIAPHLSAEASFDPVRDFAAIGLAAVTPLFIVANTRTTALRSLADLVREARANPGRLNYGSSGVGSIHHISMEVFKTALQLDIVHVPFKGSGQSVPALVAGEVPIGLATLPTVGAFVQSGQVALLAVTTAARFPEAPDVPAIAETVKEYDYGSEIGIVAPAGTPVDVVARLSGALRGALEAPEVRAKLKTLGAVPAWSSPADYAENIRANFRKFGEAVKRSGAAVAK